MNVNIALHSRYSLTLDNFKISVMLMGMDLLFYFLSAH